MKRSMKRSLSSKDLIDFILAAKIAKCNKECTWSLSHRPGSIDLQFARPSAGLVYSYSGFGHSESISQEVIYSSSDEAIWAMNQYIHIHESDDRSKINELTQEFSLKQYQQGRLLGSFNHSIKDYTQWRITCYWEFCSTRYGRKKAQNQAIFSLFGRIRRHFENRKASYAVLRLYLCRR